MLSPMDFDSKLASAPHCIFLSVFRTHCASCLVDLVISLELEASFHRRGFVRLIARNKKQTVGPSAAGVSRRVLCPDLCFPRAAAPESRGSLGSETRRRSPSAKCTAPAEDRCRDRSLEATARPPSPSHKVQHAAAGRYWLLGELSKGLHTFTVMMIVVMMTMRTLKLMFLNLGILISMILAEPYSPQVCSL